MKLVDAKGLYDRLAEISDHLTVVDKLQKTPAINIDGVPAGVILMRRLLLMKYQVIMLESAISSAIKVLDGYGILPRGSDMPQV